MLFDDISNRCANAKVKRREQWDQVIAEAKAGTPPTTTEETSRGEDGHGDAAAGTGRAISWSPKTLIQSLRSAGTGAMTWNGNRWTAAPTIDHLATRLYMTETKPSPQVEETPTRTESPSTNAPLNNEEVVFDSVRNDQLLGEEIAPLVALRSREPFRRAHLDRMEAMVANLVTRLLATTNTSNVGASLHAANPDIFAETERMIERIQELRYGDMQMPAFKLDSSALEERGELHGALRDLFANTPPHPSNLNLILAKICYNLLVSSAPPNIITYNFLIEQLSGLMLYDHAQVFIDSFFKESRFRPTSKTIQVMLNYYAATNDLEGYRAMIRRMRGVDGDMRIGRRYKTALLNPEVVRWVQKRERKLILRNGWLVQKVPRDVPIFNTLINATLQVSTVRQSVMYVRAALRENRQVDPEVLCNVVTDCVADLDYVTGESLLCSILEHWENVRKIPLLITLTKSARWALRELLHLCGIYTDQELPRQLPLDVSRWALGRLLFYLKLGSLHDQVERSRLRIRALGDAFGIVTPSETSPSTKSNPFGEIIVDDYYPKRTALAESRSSKSSLDLAGDIFKKFAYMEKNRAKKARFTTAEARRVMIQSLESKIHFEQMKLHIFEMRLVSWYYDQLDRDWRYRYQCILKENLEITMDQKIAILSDLRRLREVHRVARKVNDQASEVKKMKAKVTTLPAQIAWLQRWKKARRVKGSKSKVRKVEQKRIGPFEWRAEILRRYTSIGHFKPRKTLQVRDRSRPRIGSNLAFGGPRKVVSSR
ncbi:pentatricopeptide repeat domain-containing protein [Rutstroemia sp. NJR-2017a WRK4]|nr:pentatricopeptide repeat domain-containing protein [Rutstroemia sp. NJR-2017a WRK4]